MSFLATLTLLAFAVSVTAFVLPSNGASTRSWATATTTTLGHRQAVNAAALSRKEWLEQSVQGISGAASLVVFLSNPQPTHAASTPVERKSLDQCLYAIMRVREATFQEARLVTTGKFKDVQRANVKLAVKFILNNYRLSDTIITASAYLDGNNDRRVEAGQVGQSAVQDLQTILEYFDSSDVQNIKVDNMAGKERLVLQGLDSARKNLDGFLAYFPKDLVDAARKQVLDENELNYKEWDRSLGDIVNLPPAV
jgi:uncharacterized protein YqgV (UPF0045/DUF77 family)